jgi:Tfp pilus assembly protein PilF
VTAGHFFYIPSILLLGIVLGWILGSRAAAEAYATRLRRQTPTSQQPTPKSRQDSR